MTGIFASVITETSMTIENFLLCSLFALICGGLCAVTAAFKEDISKSFIISLVVLPLVVQTVILMVNGNIGTGIAVMGAFSLVRFRSVPGRAKDIVFLFIAMTAGLACAAGYVATALLFTALVCFVAAALVWLPVGKDENRDLRITIPETLNYSDAFADVLKEFTSSERVVKVKTCNMGSMYKIYYKVVLKDKEREKEFIDALRTRNGNLEIMLSDGERNEEL